MKRIIFILSFILFACVYCSAKMWVAQVTKSVNLRQGPSTSYNIITTIPQNAYVFYDEDDINGDFVGVIYIDKDISGYVSIKYLLNDQEVKVDESGQLQLVGSSYDYNPKIQVENRTNVNMTLKINETSYKFNPYEKRTIQVEPGNVKFIASSPGVIPYVGEDMVKSNYVYDWVFFIETQRR